MNNENEEKDLLVDNSYIKQEIIKLTYIRHIGKEPTNQVLNKILKFLVMEFENNTSKNSLDNRINSICKVIEKKIDKYLRISQI